MITPDDNANYARVKRWREKHRGLANLRQREYRKKKNLGMAQNVIKEVALQDRGSESIDPHAQTSHTIQSLRELVKREENRKPEERPTMPVVKPKVFVNDITGQVISEAAWVELQRRKAEAKLKEYELDEYSQT